MLFKRIRFVLFRLILILKILNMKIKENILHNHSEKIATRKNQFFRIFVFLFGKLFIWSISFIVTDWYWFTDNGRNIVLLFIEIEWKPSLSSRVACRNYLYDSRNFGLKYCKQMNSPLILVVKNVKMKSIRNLCHNFDRMKVQNHLIFVRNTIRGFQRHSIEYEI